MKLKSIVLAALAVVATGQAMATVTTSQSTSTLVLMVGDTNHSYLFDTGVSMADIASGNANYTAVLPNWSQFNFASTTPFDQLTGAGVRWALQTGTSGTNLAAASLMFTGSLDGLHDGSLVVGAKNSALKQDSDSLNAFSGYVGALLATGANVVGSTGDAFVGDATFNWGYGGNQNTQALTNGSNNTIGLYLETPSSSTNQQKAATFAQMLEFASFDTTTGTLTISNPAAVVPEPSSYALLLAGLGCVAFVARRRKA